MAAQQKRMLTAEKSKLGKLEPAELANILRKEAAWTTLPLEIRQHLYSMLPAPRAGEAPHDVEVNPLRTAYRPYIEEELGRWQEDLKNGFEAKKWREEALQAGRDRMDGRYDEWKEAQREEFWGEQGEEGENVEPKATNRLEGEHDKERVGKGDENPLSTFWEPKSLCHPQFLVSQLMAPSSFQHRRTHNLLLISKLLGQRDAASPFTLVLDSLEQSARPLIAEYVRRAKTVNAQVVFVSLETLRTPPDVDSFIPAWSQSLQTWQKEVTNALKAQPGQRKLLVFDSLNPLCASESANLPALLSSFINPTVSLLAVYHIDVPLPVTVQQKDAYSPAPLTLLKYLATTIFTVHSLHHVLARKAARERSHIEPSFGLEEGVEGVVQGLGANGMDGIMLEMEHRRKSGRGVREWYFLPPSAPSTAPTPLSKSRETVTLLEDHAQYRSPEQEAAAGAEGGAEGTFELGLTEKQRRDREGVVLPYFDAQKGGGEGGRILYDMGSEDDFDEEEDEI
ncbi:hypothetical protein LTR85_008096 [Meristemomyces frigidus]|nr:hypothetical protein LTR85_008096 [Meristemomyces frigidus]